MFYGFGKGNKLDMHLDELSWRSQFHQHFTGAFFVQMFVQSQTLSREKLLKLKRRAWNVDEIDT